MKTDDLIAMLASGPDVAAAAPPGAPWRAAATVGAGVLASVALMAMLLGVRPNLEQLILLPDFWIKVGFVICISLAAWHVSRRLCVPGAARGARISVLYRDRNLVGPGARQYRFATC